MNDEQQTGRRKVVLPPIDAVPGTPRDAVRDEEAPVEAVRAIAALLGRAAAPGRHAAATGAAAPAARSSAERVAASETDRKGEGDREVQIQGVIRALNDDQEAHVRDARKRLKRAQRHVEELLERLAAATPDGLSG